MKIRWLILLFVFFCVGCSSNIEKEEDNGFDIVTSFYPVYIFTQNIVQDIPGVTVTNMSGDHSGCLHDYHLTTADMKLIDNADAFVINGAGMESFLEKAYKTNEDLEVIDSSEGIPLKTERFSDEYNAHIWLSITNAISQTKNIGEQLAKLDSENEEMYIKNTDKYVKKLENLRNELREEMHEKSDVKFITSNDAFLYLADDFDFEISGIIEREEGETPTLKEIKDIIDLMHEEEIKAIFVEKDYSSKTAYTIASESGAIVNILDSITNGNGNLDDYENKMRENIKVIKESL